MYYLSFADEFHFPLQLADEEIKKLSAVNLKHSEVSIPTSLPQKEQFIRGLSLNETSKNIADEEPVSADKRSDYLLDVSPGTTKSQFICGLFTNFMLRDRFASICFLFEVVLFIYRQYFISMFRYIFSKCQFEAAFIEFLFHSNFSVFLQYM